MPPRIPFLIWIPLALAAPAAADTVPQRGSFGWFLGTTEVF